MIPFEAALVFWIVVSFLLMLDKDSARGFSLAFVVGMLILPAGMKLNISGVPNLDRDSITGIGVLLGTILFHPHVFDRFKFSLLDLILVVITGWYFVSALANQSGLYDGISQSAEFFLAFILPVFLARVHLNTPQALRTFLLVLVCASVVYLPFVVWEFRMSPQIHQTVYGYFQHQFAQHQRGGFWRPIVCFPHALVLGRFFAFTAFLALLPLRKDFTALFRPVGGYLFLAPLLGLLLSQSYSPYLLFCLLCAGYYIVQKRPWAAYAVPAVAFAWLISVMVGFTPGYGVVDAIQSVNAERADSLEYRLDALQEYRTVILTKPYFGWGGWGGGRIEGRATDSQVLISMLRIGILGAAATFAWWLLVLHMTIRLLHRTQGTVFSLRVTALTAFLSLAISIPVVDAALDPYVYLLAGACIALYQLPLPLPQRQLIVPVRRRPATPDRRGA